MERGTNRVQNAVKTKKERICHLAKSLFLLCFSGRGERI